MDNVFKDFSKELQLLIELLNSQSEKTHFVDEEGRFTDMNWDHFLELTVHHRVFPVIYNSLSAMKEAKWIPPFVMGKLKNYYQKNVFRMLMLSGETERLSGIFSSKQIRSLFLKGSVLGEHLYGDVSQRTSADIDVLIPIEALDQAEQLLVSLGYEKDDYIQTILNDWKWRHHHITFVHPQTMIKVEVHWRLNPGPSWNPAFEDLWARKRKSPIHSVPVYMLGNEDLFLFLAAHGARHGWSRLRWLTDIDLLLKKQIDWPMVKRLLKKYQLTSVGGQAIALSNALFHSEIPKELSEVTHSRKSQELADGAYYYICQMVNLHNENLPDSIAQYHKKHLFLMMSFKQKCLFILSFLFPYPEDAQALPLPKSLHVLYFPLRPILWAWRWTRRHALQ